MMMQSLMQLGFLTYYSLNVESIEAEFCVNKDKPEMCCKGKCYISKKMEQQSTEVPVTVVSENSVPDFMVTEVYRFQSFSSCLAILSGKQDKRLGADHSAGLWRPPCMI